MNSQFSSFYYYLKNVIFWNYWSIKEIYLEWMSKQNKDLQIFKYQDYIYHSRYKQWKENEE